MKHDDKFKEYVKACISKKTNAIGVANINILGDTIEEIDKNIKIALKNSKVIFVCNHEYVIQKMPEDDYFLEKEEEFIEN
jgi:hypothetical protein